MGDLTKNFSKSEFTCKCGCGYGDIHPDSVLIAQAIRDFIDEPVIVNSACRCEEHNKKSGGERGSTHTKGMATDLSCKSGALIIFEAIETLTNAGKLPKWGYCKHYIDKNFVHIDVDTKKRKNVYAAGN